MNEHLKSVSRNFRKRADDLADLVLFAQRTSLMDVKSSLQQNHLSFPQFFLLTYLSSESFLTMHDITQKMGHSPSTTTTMIDHLEKLKYVKRSHGMKDRRQVKVELSDNGLDLVKQVRSTIASDFAQLMAKGDNKSCAALGRLQNGVS